MSFHYLKIKDKYIEWVRNSRKQHEFRLATLERKNYHIGDCLCLIAENNQKHYVNVVIKKAEVLSNWEEVLSKYWIKEFSCIFNTREEALNELSSYYPVDQVQKYGIIAFEIEPKKTKFKFSRALLDTNIIIQREGHNNASFEVAQMYKWFDRLNIKKMIHPSTIDEIEKYKKEDVVKNMVTKIASYEQIIPQYYESSFFEQIMKTHKLDSNSEVDNNLLMQVFCSNVDYLVTNDKDMLKKASELYLKEYVLSVSELLYLFEKEYPDLIDYNVLSVSKEKIGSIDVNLAFFDTLREDYGGIKFNNWFNSKREEEAYVYRDKYNVLQGFLYLKLEDEDEPDYKTINPILEPIKRMKVGTFKINSTGMRLGERFVKIIIDNALRMRVSEIYVTLFENKREEVKRLKLLFEEWGFYHHGYKGEEAVLVKKLDIYNSYFGVKKNYPVTVPSPNYWILPIMPQYHSKLFPDSAIRYEDISMYSDFACSYATEKIYVTNVNNILMKPGDIVLIYRMGEYNKAYKSVITGEAIFVEALYPNSVEEYLNVCKNKSVFSESELKDFYSKRNYRTILRLLFLKSYEKKTILKDLWDIKAVDYPKGPRIGTPLSSENYKIISDKEGSK